MKDLKNKSSSPQLACHPLALPAFQFTQLIFHFNSGHKPSEPRLVLLARVTKLSSILKSDENLFFEGWMPLICGSPNAKRKTFSTSLSNIEGRAWLYALQSVLILSPKQSHVRNIARFFEHAPDAVQARIFEGRLPRTILARTVAFSGQSRVSVKRVLDREVSNG